MTFESLAINGLGLPSEGEKNRTKLKMTRVCVLKTRHQREP